ncbi:MAG: diguanylate cyclase [Flexilinea sp.]|nr:diguanylate cyclase [Flexilinea sp.]
MPETHLKFHSSNGKRQVLIVQDEIGALDSLKDMIKDSYDLLTVSDGEEMMPTIIRKRDILSLIILNITPPERLTLDMIAILKSEQDLSRIPVIVTSADREKEAQSLLMGAMDFIPKPYPPQDVILARVRRAIELSEDREIISFTERDSMTGLYNREFFYRYAVQFDSYHQDMSMDAIVVDVNHFRMINERYGKATGDEVIRQIGQNLRTSVADAGGIVCRRNGDTFLIYCPHRTDYAEILDNAAIIKGTQNIHVRLRMGVYPDVDKTLDIERRFDHAKMASDSRRGNYSNRIGFYDKALHDEEILRERLLEEFSGSLEKEQFLVFYQPKFDIRQSEPVLNSAEALVRWNHPELGLISPERFVPLFEDHGLIRDLDNYVWRKVAAQMAAWPDLFIQSDIWECSPPALSADVAGSLLRFVSLATGTRKELCWERLPSALRMRFLSGCRQWDAVRCSRMN